MKRISHSAVPISPGLKRFFFFSSRRRHTRWTGDWSSDVCSSDLDARLKALSTFLELPESASLTAANKRIANILRKANMTPPAEVDVMRLREDAEVRLFDSMRGLRDAVAAATAQHEYAGALGRLAQLRPAYSC